MIRRFPFFAPPLATVALLCLSAACQSDSDEDSADDPTPTAPAMTVAPARAQPARPSPAPVNPPAAVPPAAVPPAAVPPAAEPPAAVSASTAAAQVFAACTHTEGTYGRNCDSIFLTMKQMSPPRCVQLTVDNCGQSGRGSLGVNVPMPWRVDSGTVSSNPSRCELGAFYVDSTAAQRVTGAIRWNDSGRLPTEIELDVSLDTSTSLATPATVELTTSAPIIPSLCN